MSNWYEKSGSFDDICISTRARLARNIKPYPFGSKLSKQCRTEIIEKINDALKRSYLENAEYIDFSKIPENKAYSYFEKHYISSDFLSAPLPKQLVLSNDDGIAIMVNEEDHLRIQSIVPGLDIDKAYDTANRIDDLLSENIEYWFDNELGYLTKCPTNLGTGLRLSVMMHLPALTMTHQMSQIAKIASQFGFVIRGFYGEGSNAKGYLYQVSNQETLGFSEKQICDRMKSFTSQLIERERKARKQLNDASPDKLDDIVSRAVGTLHFAKLLSGNEFVKLYSDIRFGISLGLETNIKYETLNKLLIETAPHTLFENSAAMPDENTRDKARATLVKDTLK